MPLSDIAQCQRKAEGSQACTLTMGVWGRSALGKCQELISLLWFCEAVAVLLSSAALFRVTLICVNCSIN